MENDRLCIINLPKGKNYAIVSPHRIVYGLNASKNEFANLIKEEEKRIRKVKILKTSHNVPRLYSNSISLIPTFDCNLKCIYCYSKGGEEKKTMTLETAKIAIQTVVNAHNYNDPLDVYLVGGGEPLLPFGLVCDIINFTKSICKTVNIHVVTNATFDKNVLEWFIKNKIDTRVSYDGFMHNTQRPFAVKNGLDSKKVVQENIKSLVAGGIPVTVQCIITNDGLNSLRQTIDEIVALKVKTLKFEPVLITDVSRGTKKMEPNPVKYATALLDAIKYVAELDIDFKIDTGYFAEPSEEDYCGITHSNTITTPDGLTTACVEVAKLTDPYADPIIFGKIENNCIITEEKRLKILESLHYRNQIGCSTCNLRFICQGGCPMANIWRSGFPLTKSSYTCTLEHKLIPTLLLEIVENPKVAKVIFNDNANIKIW